MKWIAVPPTAHEIYGVAIISKIVEIVRCFILLIFKVSRTFRQDWHAAPMSCNSTTAASKQTKDHHKVSKSGAQHSLSGDDVPEPGLEM